MVSSITGQQSSNILAGLSTPQTTPSGSMASFTDQLAAALEGYLGQSGNGSHLEIDIQTTQSQNSGVRQFIVTVKNPESAPAQPAAADSFATAVTSAVAAPATPVSAASAPVAPEQASGNARAPLDENGRTNLKRAMLDAYWAAQPPAVQKLRDTAGLGERSALAQELADQGYTIDRPIMVWGWDPMKTMLTRKMYGYNWVPSFNQANVATPNMTAGGETPYDAGNAPPGSIAVNTDFADGLNITDPWA